MRLFLFTVAALLLAGLTWYWRDSLGLGSVLGAAGSSSARKCLHNGQVVYTDGTCPAGSREQALSGGTVTVIEAGPKAAPAASAAAGPGNVRDLLLDPNAVNIREKRMDAVIGR